jgi:hypothetical protein
MLRLFFFVPNAIATLAFCGALAFAISAARAGVSVHPQWPSSILLFFFAIPAIAFLCALFIAWRCTRGAPSAGALLFGVACAAVAFVATAALLAIAIELTVRREMPGAIPWLVAATLFGLASLPVASAVNLGFAARALLVRSHGVERERP